MKIYLNVSCWNRPYDDQSQMRIRLEAEAVTLILEKSDKGSWELVGSEIVDLEVNAISDVERRDRIQELVQDADVFVKLTPIVFDRATDLERLGFKPADALHVAAAETAQADVLLSCDDRFCRIGDRSAKKLAVKIANPLQWLKEIGHDSNA